MKRNRTDDLIIASGGEVNTRIYGIRAWIVVLPDTLVSPMMATPWTSDTLTAHDWSDESGLRGCAGIHARHAPAEWRPGMPVPDWSLNGSTAEGPQRPAVWGVIERFGRAVEGPLGFRTQSAMIVALRVADSIDPKIAHALAARYHVAVWYRGSNVTETEK